MKKLFCIISSAIALLALPAFGGVCDASAQDMSEFVKGKRISLDYLFVANKGKKSFSGNGTVTYQDGAYSLVSETFRVYNDCQKLWVLDYGAKEATVEPATDEDILSNPRKLLSQFGFNAKDASVVPAYDNDGIPSGMDVTLKNGDKASIRFSDVRISEAGSLSDFTFNKKTLDRTWVITEL